MNIVWHCSATTFILQGEQEKIAYITAQCKEHLNKTMPWRRPISHIVQRQLDAWMRQDSSTKWDTGGYCAGLKFWWQVPWTEFGAEVVKGIAGKRTYFNGLESVAIVINFFAAAATFEVAVADPL